MLIGPDRLTRDLFCLRPRNEVLPHREGKTHLGRHPEGGALTSLDATLQVRCESLNSKPFSESFVSLGNGPAFTGHLQGYALPIPRPEIQVGSEFAPLVAPVQSANHRASWSSIRCAKLICLLANDVL